MTSYCSSFLKPTNRWSQKRHGESKTGSTLGDTQPTRHTKPHQSINKKHQKNKMPTVLLHNFERLGYADVPPAKAKHRRYLPPQNSTAHAVQNHEQHHSDGARTRGTRVVIERFLADLHTHLDALRIVREHHMTLTLGCFRCAQKAPRKQAASRTQTPPDRAGDRWLGSRTA